jgi:ABC-type transport system involved in multi-copper enzyme maturation permease subunit
MYAWKCWRETRARFIVLVIGITAAGIFAVLAPGLNEHNGSWSFDRAAYTRNPAVMAEIFLIPVLLGVLWGSGFLAGAFLGMTSPGSELDTGTIEYLWTRPRARATFLWTHWCISALEVLLVALVPMYVAVGLLSMLTGNWHQPLLMLAPWLIALLGLASLGLTVFMTALRGSASGGLIFTSGIIVAYVILRQIATGPLHLNLPPLFMGPIAWMMTYYTPNHISFPWGSFTRVIVCAVAFPLLAQYLLKRAEV